jgi:hypothetical protein
MPQAHHIALLVGRQALASSSSLSTSLSTSSWWAASPSPGEATGALAPAVDERVEGEEVEVEERLCLA